MCCWSTQSLLLPSVTMFAHALPHSLVQRSFRCTRYFRQLSVTSRGVHPNSAERFTSRRYCYFSKRWTRRHAGCGSSISFWRVSPVFWHGRQSRRRLHFYCFLRPLFFSDLKRRTGDGLQHSPLFRQ